VNPATICWTGTPNISHFTVGNFGVIERLGVVSGQKTAINSKISTTKELKAKSLRWAFLNQNIQLSIILDCCMRKKYSHNCNGYSARREKPDHAVTRKHIMPSRRICFSKESNPN
jgi:hypothetical protein